MDTKYYTCLYCHEEFIPKRRHVQKFCSATCRSKAHHQKNKNSTLKPISVLKPITDNSITKNKIDKMSVAGVANATAGYIAANVLKSAFTDERNKPATKGDILALRRENERYHRIINLAMRPDGTFPHFDIQKKILVYLKPNNALLR
jgi:hypothetical protein